VAEKEPDEHEEYEERRVQIELVLTELRRREDGQDRRLQRSETISAFLIAAAAVSATLFAADNSNWWIRSAMLLSLASTGLAILSLFPRPVPGIDEVRLLGALKKRPRDAAYDVATSLQRAITLRERTIRLRMRLLKAGLVVLAAALTCVVLAAFGIHITIT
jgi:hypothetical protein